MNLSPGSHCAHGSAEGRKGSGRERKAARLAIRHAQSVMSARTAIKSPAKSPKPLRRLMANTPPALSVRWSRGCRLSVLLQQPDELMLTPTPTSRLVNKQNYTHPQHEETTTQRYATENKIDAKM
ncbi:hypothetical protein Q1695_013569 [Nippostrongylus brasiliensis]|nr:hypothetical protein Q1695_013569 [Nippostrongylus brasiliensis]